MTPKGDHIPKEDRGEGTRWKAPLTTRPEKRNPGVNDQHRPWRRPDSRADQRKPKATASARGSGTARRPKANPTKGGKAMSRSWTEEEPRPDQRQVT